LTGASQKIASLVATANQAQFQACSLNPVLVRSLHGGTQQVVVTTSSTGESGQVTLIPQSVQLLHQHSSGSGLHSGAIQQTLVTQASQQPVQLVQQQQQLYQQQVILQKPSGSDQHMQPQSDQEGWGSQEATFHVLMPQTLGNQNKRSTEDTTQELDSPSGKRLRIEEGDQSLE
jgi:hypothetical protein